MVPCKLANGSRLDLSPGEHSELIREIIERFAPRFAPGSQVVYIGDTGNKGVIFDEAYLAKMGIVRSRAGQDARCRPALHRQELAPSRRVRNQRGTDGRETTR